MQSEHVGQNIYRIVVKGHLDSEWSEWFDGLTITTVDNGETILTGPIVDQTALHGVLIKIRDLALPLLSLTRIETGRENEAGYGRPLETGSDTHSMMQHSQPEQIKVGSAIHAALEEF